MEARRDVEVRQVFFFGGFLAHIPNLRRFLASNEFYAVKTQSLGSDESHKYFNEPASIVCDSQMLSQRRCANP